MSTELAARAQRISQGAAEHERLFDRVDLHARLRPNALAVDGEAGSLTYADLAAQSRKFASLLIRRGVVRGDRVAIFAHKSPQVVAAIYGILRAGAAYVPLSPDLPAERVHWILRDVGAKAVVTDEACARELRAEPGTHVVVLDGHDGVFWRELTHGYDDSALGDGVAADDLAYVIYTSGSTGNPKGVMHSHRSGGAFVRWAAEELELFPSDRVSSHAPFQFDLSIFDIYATSWAGATLVLPSGAVAGSPLRFVDWLEEARISIVYSVPGVWVAGLGGRPANAFPRSRLRRIIYAGEPMAAKFALLLQRTFPEAAIYNFYGPTETNVCTAYLLPRLEDGALPKAIPIGSACSGDRVYLEDGELVVEGESLLLGYWNKPPRGAKEPYRTGDLVEWDAKLGGYVFLGRRDGMRKIRGFRIELGEVEACLLANPSASEVVATVDQRDPAHPTVVAFVVPSKDAARDAMDLKRHCARFLPPYMVPRIVFRDSLPRTTNGKTDRRALDAELLRG